MLFRSARAISLLEKHISEWDLTARSGALSLVTAWELSPLASRRPKTFSRMTSGEQDDWVSRNSTSRFASRRLLLQGLKQLVFLAWACAPEVEEALGYDYRCARDNEPHGAPQVALKDPHVFTPPRKPRNYARKGPAVHVGAVPEERMAVTSFSGPSSRDLTTRAWPDP